MNIKIKNLYSYINFVHKELIHKENFDLKQKYSKSSRGFVT